MAKKILVVDDNDDLRKELGLFLEDHEVLEAASGEEALSLLSRAHNIGLILLDVMMPGISGLDVLESVKKTDPSVGIIILTGHSSKDIAIDALKAHADDYIEKPIQIKKLQYAVDRLLLMQNGEPEISSLDLMGKLNQVKRFIEDNCYKKTHLTDAANAVCLSPKYLSRVFKEYLHVGFNEYKLEVKMQEAKKLLVNRGYTVNQIADKLGYENPESFIRQFKKFTRQTPAAYRKKIKNQKILLKKKTRSRQPARVVRLR